MNSIPKIIHQIYNMSGKEEGIREDYRIYRDTWLANHPHWEYRYWDHVSSRKLVEEEYPWFLSSYDAYPHFIQRCDAIRYFILHRYGGLYVDMDMENLKQVDELFEDCELALFKAVKGYTNAALASAPGHPFWQAVFKEMPLRVQNQPHGLFGRPERSNSYYICWSTGPILISDIVEAGGFDRMEGTRVQPTYLFEPLSPRECDGKIIQSNDTSKSYAIHHMTMHWLSPKDKVLQAIYEPLTKIYWSWVRFRNRQSAAAATNK
jgi:mannosyltransferase OCH1-like enzyme